MSKSEKQIGDMGETTVCEYLKNRGFIILKRNYRIPGGEIDIIARQDHMLAFIEVKTRKNDKYAPSEAVDRSKQKRIIKTAEVYLYEMGFSDFDVRFDVAEVIYGSNFGINYIENAFWSE